MKSLSFRMVIRGSRLIVAINGTTATYRLLTGTSLELTHHGLRFVLQHNQPVILDIPKSTSSIAPTPPKGREPYCRTPSTDST